MKAKYHIVIFAALFAAGFMGCKTESEGSRDTVPPGMLSNVEFTPVNGADISAIRSPMTRITSMRVPSMRPMPARPSRVPARSIATA